MGLLLDRDRRVIAANKAARDYFEIEPERLPASLVEVTLEGKLVDVMRAGRSDGEIFLVHRRRHVRTKLVPGPRPGETLMFLIDITDLRQLERIRQEFIANLVHELKTPITSLRLTAEALEGDPPVKERRRFAERLVREADLLSKIIDNLRQLAEIESRELSTEISTFDLGEFLDEAARRIGTGRVVNLDVPQALVVSTDRPKLAQALGNLLDNATKFSPPDTAIDVTAAVTNGELRISVRDRGPGISPEHWGRVFERFYKVDRARPREAGGFGLGLAISKHLVQAIGGKIWTETSPEGGQVFTISLPSALTGA